MRKYYVVLLLWLLAPSVVNGQTGITALAGKIKSANNDSIKAEAYTDIFLYYVESNQDSAIWYCNEGLNYFAQNSYKNGQAKMLSLLAQADIENGKLDLSKKRFQDALELYKECDNKLYVAILHNRLGMIEGKKGNFVAASIHFHTALKIFENINHSHGIMDTYVKLGIIDELSDSLDKALSYYTKAANINDTDTLSLQAASMYNNIGVIYGKKHEYSKALSYFELGLSKCQDPGFITLKIGILINISLTYSELNNAAKSLEYLDKALNLANERNIPEQESKSLQGTGLVFFKTDNSKSVSYLIAAVGIQQKMGINRLLADIYENLMKIYKNNGNYRQALDFSEKRQHITDSVERMEKAAEIANLQALYELDRSNAKVKQLTYLIHKNSIKRSIILIATFCNLVILVVLAFSYRKSTLLNKQLVKRTMELTEANEIKDKLFSIIGHDLRGPIGNIPLLLDLYIDEQIEPDEREYFFNSIKELATSCKDTLDKMLYWGKSNIRGNRINQQVFETKEHINNCLKLIKSGASQKNITLVDNTPPDLKINADTEHFEFVVRNLLANAVKFTFNDGKIEINSDNRSIPGFTVFSVKDTGKGIEPQKIPRIFEALDHGSVGTAHEKGTNIGLKLCKDFITENGGNIWVESEVGKGAVFFFTLKKA